jgi:uncharacterized caspase-like protein
MRGLRFFILLAFSVYLGCGTAFAEKRVALVIGNSAYKNVAKLTNPANDAALVGGMFTKAGFDSVDVKYDLNVVDMRKALREFGARTRDADVAVIYYAGHGIELDGNNYLIPTDATLETDTDVFDETFPLDRVLFAIEPARQLRLVILDACRDNPFARSMRRTVASRAVGRGLAKVEPSSPNTMIAFAAKAGSTASDGDSGNSPFAMALAERLPTPGLDLRKALGFVRDDVLKKTGYKQEPYVYGSLGGNDVPLVPGQPAATGPQASPQDAVRRDYELALQIGTREVWTAFLAKYPDGFYASLAQGQLNRIAAEDTRAAAAEKARQAEEAKARLSAERAKAAEQQEAAAAAKVAEDARLAAEKAKQLEEARAAAAEQTRKDAEAAAAKVVAEKQAADKALADKAARDKAAADAEAIVDKGAAEKQAAESKQAIAALAPPPSQPRRVGCLATQAQGDWNASAQRSLVAFNKNAGTSLDTRLASLDALDAIKARQGRVCPLVCEHGFRADGDHCVKVTCRAGFQVNDDSECEKVPDKKPAASREESRREQNERAKTDAAPAKPPTSAQMVCNGAGCRPVQKGCRLEARKESWGSALIRNIEVCN